MTRAIYGLRAYDSNNFVFAFYGLIACNPHLCETERRRKKWGKKGGKKNTSGGHSSGRAFIAVGTMSLDDVISAEQPPVHLFTEYMETDIKHDMFHFSRLCN